MRSVVFPCTRSAPAFAVLGALAALAGCGDPAARVQLVPLGGNCARPDGGNLVKVTAYTPSGDHSQSVLLGQTLAIGETRLKVVKRIKRCAAVNVDPDTAQRDLAIPAALQRRLGHADCGIYAEVIEGGSIAEGDTIAAEQPALL